MDSETNTFLKKIADEWVRGNKRQRKKIVSGISKQVKMEGGSADIYRHIAAQSGMTGTTMKREIERANASDVEEAIKKVARAAAEAKMTPELAAKIDAAMSAWLAALRGREGVEMATSYAPDWARSDCRNNVKGVNGCHVLLFHPLETAGWRGEDMATANTLGYWAINTADREWKSDIPFVYKDYAFCDSRTASARFTANRRADLLPPSDATTDVNLADYINFEYVRPIRGHRKIKKK